MLIQTREKGEAQQNSRRRKGYYPENFVALARMVWIENGIQSFVCYFGSLMLLEQRNKTPETNFRSSLFSISLEGKQM